jgi:hypothetical protein
MLTHRARCGLCAVQVRTTAFPAAAISSGAEASLEEVSPDELAAAKVSNAFLVPELR